MALLPLSLAARQSQAEVMNEVISQPLHSIRGFACTIARVVAECNYATRRMTQLTLAPDRHLADPYAAPDTYAEFLYRTSGILSREPTARARARASQ
jgi:hypothetical protein